MGLVQVPVRRSNGCAAGYVDTEAHSSRAGSMCAEGALQCMDHLIDRPGRRLREQALDDLHLRIGRDIAAFLREDVESLMPPVHRELSLIPEEPKFFSGGGEEVPVIVFVLANLPLEKDIDPGDARLSQRIEDELAPGSRARRGATSAGWPRGA